MTDTAVTTLTVVGSILGGGVLGTIATAWATRGSAREQGATAVVGPLLARLDAQDKRADQQDAEIRKLRSDVDASEGRHTECERRNILCEQKTTQQAAKIAEQDEAIRDLRARLANVRAEVRRSITPQDFAAVHPTEGKEG